MNNVVRRYARYNVPRYTSYPTAADFTTAVAAKKHAAWLGELDARESVSLYLHVPYCREICLCYGCNTKMAVCDDAVGAYRDAAEAEIGLSVGLIGHKDRPASSGRVVPIAIMLGTLGLAAFLWSLRNGQYDDLDGAAWRAIADDAPVEDSSAVG